MTKLKILLSRFVSELIAAPLWRRGAAVAATGAFLGVLVHMAIAFGYQVYSAPSAAESDFAADFETGDLGQWPPYAIKQFCCPHSVTVTDERARNGARAVRIELGAGDPDVKKSKRAEFRLRGAPFEQEMEYRFSVFIPEDWRADDIPVTLAQWHGIPNKELFEAGRAPPLRLGVLGDEWAVVSIWDRRLVTRTRFQKFEPEGVDVIYRGPLVRGRWVDWAFRVRWAHGDNGAIEVAMDGETAGLRLGPNAYRDYFAPYFKLGLYIPDWDGAVDKARANRRIAYFDDVSARRLAAGGAD